MKRQQGFGMVVGLLAVVVLLILGSAGWFVWLRNSAPSAEKTAAQTDSAPAITIESTVYSKVPSDLQQAIFAETQKSTPGCIENSQIVDYNKKPTDQKVTYAPRGFAITGIGCDSGSAFLFAKVDGTWQTLAHTQMAYPCSVLKAHHVPAKLLEVAYQGTSLDPPTCSGDNPDGPLQKYTN